MLCRGLQLSDALARRNWTEPRDIACAIPANSLWMKSLGFRLDLQRARRFGDNRMWW
jgi:hypothetical protein